MQQNTLVSEIFAGIIAVLLVGIGGVLWYVGKIGYSDAISLFIIALGIMGINIAIKAPSPVQAQQLTAQQTQIASMQELALNVANTQQSLLAQAHTHAEPVQAPVVQSPPVQPVPQFISYGRHFPGDSAVMPVVTPQ